MGWRDISQPFSPAMESRARVAALRDRLVQGNLAAAVVGAGKSGRAAAELLRAHHAQVSILDDRPVGDGPISKAAIDAADLVVLSPGVPRTKPELTSAIAVGKLVSEIELASWFVMQPMVGITGTNGKSTTTALVAHILETAGKKVFAGGNLGRPLSELAISQDPVDVVCVELSSYQLESIVDAKFAVACWLNLQPDHADRYPDEATYAAAKRRILERRAINGIAVLNAKDRWCSEIGIRVGGPTRWFAAAGHSDLAGPMGTLSPDNQAVRTVWDARETYRLTNNHLPGQHNRANICAAIECARYFEDVSVEQVQLGIDTFSGLPHRLERVAENNGVRWYNDSKATNVESSLTAVRAIDGPKLLILGGKDKGASWAPLVDEAQNLGVKSVYLIGEGAGVITAAFEGTNIPLHQADTLERAVALCGEAAERGDAVLLSPGCASFDQFDNFEHRGDTFRQLVNT